MLDRSDTSNAENKQNGIDLVNFIKMFSNNKIKKLTIAQILSVVGRSILVDISHGLMVISRKQMLTS